MSILYFLGIFDYWDGFPVLFSATRLGLMAWCLFGLVNLFIKTEPAETSRKLKRIWFCLVQENLRLRESFSGV